jgi:hypothetical protein
MAYEVEAIAPSDANAQSIPNSQIQMREEKVLEPYRARVAPQPKSGQPDKVERVAPAEAPASPAAESVTLSPAAAALARKEQKFRQNEQALKAKEAALEAERAEIAELKSLRAKLQAKDYSGVENLIKYDEYTNYLIEKAGSQDPQAEALKKLETKIEDLEKNQKSDVDKRFEAAVAQRRQAVQSIVDADKSYSKFKGLKMNGPDGKPMGFSDAVVQHILDTWENDSIDLEPDKAAAEVREILKEKAKAWAEILKDDETPAPPAVKNPLPLKSGVKTLTNNVTTSGELKSPRKSLHGLSDTERWAEARRRAEEKLKG